MRVVLVGGSGFVGRRTVRMLRADGHDVVNVGHMTGGGVLDVESIDCELTDPEDVARAAEAVGATNAVVWLAANIAHEYGVVASVAARDLRVMVQSPMELLHTMIKGGRKPAAFVFISSVQVYGKPVRMPVTEDHPTDPFTAYGVAKIYAEKVLKLFCKQNNVVFTALRPAFIYGPGQHGTNALPKFIDRVKNGQPPLLNGDGTDVRDDVHVDDVAFAIKCALEKKREGVYNVSSGKGHTLRDIAEAVCALGGGKVQPEFTGNSSNWVNRWYGIERARQELGYAPRISFSEGVAELWALAQK